MPGKHRKRGVTTMSYAHLTKPIDQWECAYCLKYFINNDLYTAGSWSSFGHPFACGISFFFFLVLNKHRERTISIASWNIIYKFQRNSWKNYSLIPSFKGNSSGFGRNGGQKPAHFPSCYSSMTWRNVLKMTTVIPLEWSSSMVRADRKVWGGADPE